MTISILQQQEVLGKTFNIYGTKEDPIFLAKDVAEWIEHNQPSRMIELVEEDEKLKCLVNTSGQNREMWFLTEEGIEEVLFQSRKPIAKKFKKEVKKILKEIRLNGAYVQVNEGDSDEVIMARGIEAMQRALDRKDAELLEKQALIEIQQVDVELIEVFTKSEDNALVRDVAKLLSDGNVSEKQGTLFNKLIEWKWVCKERGKYKPTQLGIDRKYVVFVQSISKTGNPYRTVKITTKGQKRIFEKLREESSDDKSEQLELIK